MTDFDELDYSENSSQWVKQWEVNARDRKWVCLECGCEAPYNGKHQYLSQTCPCCGRTMRNMKGRTI